MEYSIEPFIKLSDYPFVICKVCRYAFVADEVEGHLRRAHKAIRLRERRQIARVIKAMPGIIQDQAELSGFQLPPPTTKPIRFIHAPRDDTIGCAVKGCQFVTGTVRGIRRHATQKHGWVNPRRRGRSSPADEPSNEPWRYGIRAQRFFSSRAASGWFEVGADAPDSQMPDEAAIVEQASRAMEQQQQRFEQEDRECIQAADAKLDANTWLQHVGWATHLEGFEPEAMRQLVEPVGPEEAVLQLIHDSMVRVMEQARAVATPDQVGSQALFEVQRKEVDKKPRRPFDNRVEEDTWARYMAVWSKLVCYIYRAESMDDGDRPAFRLTKRQGEAIDAMTNMAEAYVENPGTAPLDWERMDELTLQAVIALLDHRLTAGEYRSAIVSGLAVMGIRKDGGWVDVLDYTPVYSAVIKVARAVVVYQSFRERQAEVVRLQEEKRLSEEEADEEAPSIFRIVRGKVQRFMTITSKEAYAEPTPMDWIYEARTYGMHIRYNTPAEGTIDWDGDQIKHRRVRFRIGELTEMLHALTREAHELLASLAMVDDVSELPRIPWSAIEDDHSEDQVGYSFLEDDRNREWSAAGKSWNMRRIGSARARRQDWFDHGRDDGKPFQASAVQSYGETLRQFMERVFLLMHMTGGQPARATEILGIRHKNTMNGGVRNIFAHNGMMCFVTAYHKGFRATGQVKVIHRYLPREVGELLAWYLWLVLPFWQQVQGIIQDAAIRSPFLWPDQVVRKAAASPTEQREKRHAEMEREPGSSSGIGEGEGEGWIYERKWTSDRVRRIIQRHSRRLLGAQLNISSWRQIAIAIARRYLNGAFKESTWEGDGDGEDEEDDGLDDNPADLQAGHGTHIAGMVYARELQQGLFSTASMRDKFRAVSRQWHRLLEFPDGYEGPDGGRSSMGLRRKREPYQTEREHHQFARFRRLQQVDIAGQLRQMMGPDAAFRGQQEAVIRAIVRGESPIVQVAGTGGGKSMSFMLPAYCADNDGGTTIVIVPLVSLREDMQRRCAESEIGTYIWDSRSGHQMAPIVFVTPESAVTKGFGDFVNRMQMRCALDRVVVDECHALLDSDDRFRPQMLELGRIISSWGVQKVFLTATLPPSEEGRFFEIAGLTARRVKMFRSATVRPNIRYRVEDVQARSRATSRGRGRDRDGGSGVMPEEAAEDDRVVQIVREWIYRANNGRAIVYAGTIERVERLARRLECSAYHSQIDTAAGKMQRLRVWMEGGRLIVATNALGLGVDVPDVRLVIHAGMPSRLRDYAQESGRGGRDGGLSEAVMVVCRPPAREKAEQKPARARGGKPREAAVEDFMSGKWCRRVVLDRVMDGRYDRAGCQVNSEAACDVCEGQRERWEAEEAISWCEREEIGRAEEIGIEQEHRTRYEQMRRTSRFEQFQSRQTEMQTGLEVGQLEEELGMMAGRCVGCFTARGRIEEDQIHARDQCRQRGARWWRRFAAMEEKWQRQMFKKGVFADYSGCFWCGMPQSVCMHWDACDDDGGRFQIKPDGVCQYEGLLVGLWAAATIEYPEQVEEVLQMMDPERVFDWQEEVDEGLYQAGMMKWLGERIQWGWIETSRFCRGFHEIFRKVIDIGGSRGDI